MIAFETVLQNLDGSDMLELDKDGKLTGKPVTLLIIATNSLLAQFQDEQNISGDEKYNRFKLAEKIHSKNVPLTPEEIVLIRKLIAKGYAPGIVGPCYDLLK